MLASCGSEASPIPPIAGGAAGSSTESSAEPTGPEVFPSQPVNVFEAGSRPRVMIVGDSISAGPGCYKGRLVEALGQNGYSDFEFVGEYTDDCGAGVMHSAVSCSTATHFTQETFTMDNCFVGENFAGLATLAETHKPDLILLQLGVNDVWNGRAETAILADYAELIRQARAQNPKIVLVVAQIQKIRPDCDAEVATVFDRAQSLVNAVPAWAQGQSTEESPVYVADLWTESDWTEAETNDCIHPNDVGAERMGQNWFNALRNILNAE